MVGSLPANAGDGFEPWSGKISHAVEQLGPWATLLSLRIWSLCSATGEAAIVRGLRAAMKSGPHSPRLDAQKRRPNTAKKKKKRKEHSLTPYSKIKLKMDYSVIVRLDTIKLLEENIGRTLFDINHSSNFSESVSYSKENKNKNKQMGPN